MSQNKEQTIKKNDEICITIDDLTIEGAGIGRYNGMAVFVPRALPGETVKIKIIKLTKNYAVARLIEVLKPSLERVKPFCGFFELCGGCTLQHLSYEGQLKYKSRRIRECFKRLGGIEIETPEIIAAGNTLDYRNKASFPISCIFGRAEAGFYAPHSHRIIAVDCPIQKQPINDIKNAVIDWANRENIPAYNENKNSGTLRHIIGRMSSNGDLMAGVVINGKINKAALISSLSHINGLKSITINFNNKNTNAILGTKDEVIYGDPYITESFEGLSFRTGLSSFLQINHEQAEKLYETALSYAGISRNDIIFDLFCGIGTLSLLAAKNAKRVIGIEYVESAVKNAKENARQNGIGNAEFIDGDAGKMLERGIDIAGSPDIVILDPPRKGCDSSLIAKLAEISPEKIVYVSCNPATLARDAALFCESGYLLKAIKGVDMFPHTTHVECVVLMSKNI